jgi:hypothetical protein
MSGALCDDRRIEQAAQPISNSKDDAQVLERAKNLIKLARFRVSLLGR